MKNADYLTPGGEDAFRCKRTPVNTTARLFLTETQHRPDVVFAAAERVRLIIRTLDKMPEEPRAVLLLRTVEDLSHIAIARTLRIPLAEVYAIEAEAREIFKTLHEQTLQEHPLLQKLRNPRNFN